MPDFPTRRGAIAQATAPRAPERRGAHRLRLAAARALLLLSLVHATAASAGDLSSSVPAFRPHFPVFGGGKFVNVFENDAALTNASAHVAWSLAIPLLGKHLGGRKGLWVAGLSWIALSLTQEALFHAPPKPGPAYPSEVRADLLTRIVPAASLLVWDLVRGGRPPAARPHMIPPDRLGRFGLEILPPNRADHLLREAALRMPVLATGIEAPAPATAAPPAAPRLSTHRGAPDRGAPTGAPASAQPLASAIEAASP